MTNKTIGRFKLVDIIGRGGMAVVYRAYDPRFQRDVAIKIMTQDLLDNAKLIARFEREARTIAALEHPAIVPVYDFGEHEERPYLVMRLMTGGTLSDRLKKGRLPIKQTVAILDRIGSALERAHQQGIIHRDLKPSNIMFDSYGDAFLADFGIARLTKSATTLTGESVIGTPAYMSPEQIHGDKEIDGRSDIYALGIITFEMLTGKRPFEDKTAAKIMMRHILDPVPNIRRERPDLPPAAEEAINRTLAKDPNGRYAAAGELAQTLRALVPRESPTTDGPSVAWSPEPKTEPYAQETKPATAGMGEPYPETEVLMPSFMAAPAADTEVVTPERPVIPERTGAAPGTAYKAASRRWLWWVIFAGIGLIGILVIITLIVAGLGGGDSVVTSTELPAEDVALIVTETATPAPAPTDTPAAPATDTPTATPLPTTTPTMTPTLAAGEIRAFLLPDRSKVDMVFVPAGLFLMGSDGGDDDELPAHQVYLDAFWIDRTEVTNEQFSAFVADTGYVTTAEEEGTGYTYSAGSWDYTDGADWRHPTGPDSEIDGLGDHPVIMVSWDDAFTYCIWRDARLPTEAEWEKAARGNDERTYPWGDNLDGGEMNYCDRNCPFDWRNEDDDGYEFSAPVGIYPAGASPYGALDMAGNVWEWVADWYDGDYYDISPAANPAGPDNGDLKVMRGGSWNNKAWNVRVTERYSYDFDRFLSVGFRCASNPK